MHVSQDFLHEMEYRAMYRGEINKDNNWGFYLYKTAKDRQQRIKDYQHKSGGATVVVTTSPLQMRRRSSSGKRRRSRSDSRKQKQTDDSKIMKKLRVRKKLTYDDKE